jgi:hypothetical protein
MWYVYELWDPRTNKPFYVGKGVFRRLYNTVSKNEGNSLKRKFMSEIKKAGLKVELRKIAEYDTEAEALCHEKDLISKYGRIISGDGILTNYSIGGDSSNAGWIPSEETRKLWSEQRRNKKQSVEQIAARVSAITGRKNTKEQNLNCSKARIRSNAELKKKIIEKLDQNTYFHGMLKSISKELNCNYELVIRIYKNLEFYKAALNEQI